VPEDEVDRLRNQVKALYRRMRREQPAIEGMSITELQVLTTAARSRTAMRPGQLGDELQMTSPNVAAALRSLEKMGMVSRRRDPKSIAMRSEESAEAATVDRSGQHVPPAPVRSGGALLVECLLAHDVPLWTCVPGESFLPVLDALYGVQEQADGTQIRLITARHEAAAANMAEAAGKLTGRAAVCMVTRGPGATHASIALHTAFQDGTPLILVVGQVARAHLGRQAFQEMDYSGVFGSSAKSVVTIMDADRIPEHVARAIHTAHSGRPGPVVLVLPEDVLTQLSSAPAQVAPRVTPPEVAAPWPPPVELSANRQIRLVIGRQLRLLLANRVYLVFLVLLPLVFAACVFIGAFLIGQWGTAIASSPSYELARNRGALQRTQRFADMASEDPEPVRLGTVSPPEGETS